MREYLPIIAVGATLGLIALAMLVAFIYFKSKADANAFERTISDKEIIKRLFRYARPYTLNFVFIVILTLISVSYQIFSPYLVGYVEELIKDPFELGELIRSVVLFFTILIVSVVCSFSQSIILQKTGQRIVSDIREETFSHIESLSHAQLNEIPVGKLVTRVSNDAESVSRVFTNVATNLVKNTFVIVGVLAAMLVLNYELTLIVLCFVPFVIIFTMLFRWFARRAYRREKERTSEINAFLSENLSGMKVIQSFNAADYKYEQFSVKCRQHAKACMGTIFVFSVFRPLVFTLYLSAVLFLFYFGAKGYLDGASLFGQTITGGVIVSFYMYISRFFDPIQELAEQFNVLQSAFASAEKIFLINDMQPTVTDRENAKEITSLRGDIEFRHVWFRYNTGDWVLKDLSFKINAGETAAFVGATGSGKTTILSLICRNYDVNEGQILIDGIDIRDIKISSLRKLLGQMPQDVFLFTGTVRSNLTLGDDIPDDKILSVCKKVNADKLINSLKDGLDEKVLVRSENFSAGERQLLSFARMSLRDPGVIILDEATSNIDTETEQLIKASVETMMKSGTALIVAHRLSTIKNSDKIFVLSHGEIIEQGNHSKLIEKRGKYFELYTLQSKKEELKR
ncbi:MAG: ATP-binding cassette domain-containing protein [Clostridia bacterium]|nr:ATP-binding cassette domain-containing protein [Clostridia bacterium]